MNCLVKFSRLQKKLPEDDVCTSEHVGAAEQANKLSKWCIYWCIIHVNLSVHQARSPAAISTILSLNRRVTKPDFYKLYVSCTVHHSTSVMNLLLNLLRIKDLYMFRALLAYPQEVPHNRHLVYCVRVTSVGCYRGWSGIEFYSIPGSAN
jgi:hypothetical protein